MGSAPVATHGDLSWRTNHTAGWLLRADLHRALDAGPLELCPETGRVLRAEPGAELSLSAPQALAGPHCPPLISRHSAR